MQNLALVEILDGLIQSRFRRFHGDSAVILDSGVYFDTFAGHIAASVQAHSTDDGALLTTKSADFFDKFTEDWLLRRAFGEEEQKIEPKLLEII